MKIINFGKGSVFKWNKEYLIQILTSGSNPILTDPVLTEAIRSVDRKNFVPMIYKDKAYDDIEIEIGYSEKLNKPTLIASMLAFLKPKPGGKYLDIGGGTGYAAMILATVAGEKGKVYSIERIQWIWEIARENLKNYPNIKNLQFLYKNGLEGLPNQAPFDGIHVGFSLEEIPETLKLQLNPNGGRLVCPTHDNHLRIVERTDKETFEEEIVPGFTLDKGKEGVA